MRVLSLYQAVNLSYRLWKLDLTHVESYKGFSERFDGKWKNPTLNEPQIREAYDLWRRDVIKGEVRRELQGAHFNSVLATFLASWPRRINIIAMCLLVLAVVFPPYYLTTGDQSLSMGLTQQSEI